MVGTSNLPDRSGRLIPLGFLPEYAYLLRQVLARFPQPQCLTS